MNLKIIVITGESIKVTFDNLKDSQKFCDPCQDFNPFAGSYNILPLLSQT